MHPFYAGSAVVFEEVAGRTTAIVPSVQLLRSPLVILGTTNTARGKTKIKAESSLTTADSISAAVGATTVAMRKRKISHGEIKVEVKEEVIEEVKVALAQRNVKQKVKEEGNAAPARRKSPRLA